MFTYMRTEEELGFGRTWDFNFDSLGAKTECDYCHTEYRTQDWFSPEIEMWSVYKPYEK